MLKFISRLTFTENQLLQLGQPAQSGSMQLLEPFRQPGRAAQSVGHLTRKSGVLGPIFGLATYFRFSFRFSRRAVVVALVLYVHGKHLRSCRDGQLS